jgi:sodium transport system permease protein|tara:strand:+ start:41683 stop:42861 length:1179 start_codon:yes stop_codon:yes gene_type:complete
MIISNMSQFNALLGKELKEAFRDKRAMMLAMMMAVMAPVMIFAMSKVMIKEAVETPAIYLKVLGAEFAPKLINALNDENILVFSDVPSNKKTIWDERNLTLTIPESFNQDMLDGKTIEVYLSADYSEKANLSPVRRIKNTINNYTRAIGYKRLLVRGIDVRLLQVVKIIEQDTSLPNSNAMIISMMLGLYLLMAAFMSGLPVAIDASAGERERNVLEMLLCQPVSTVKIVSAKLCCASLIACIGVLLTLSLTSFSVSFIDLTKIGASFSLDAFTILALLLLLLPICFFASALQLFVAFQSKNFKEAQSMVSMIIMLPAMVPVVMMFVDDKPKWLEWLPISGQSLIMEDLFKGLPVSWSLMGFTGLVTISMTIILVLLMAKKLRSETVVLALS